ncbi:MAG: hypothetical protein CL600_08080 [Alteromonas sp.]|nr:hypothetical protein [Alteromonas sp.]
MQVNRAELAEILGLSLPSVDSRVKRGMPYVSKGGRGREWVFESSDCVAWEKQQAINNAIGDTALVDAEELKQRKLAAETSIAEIEAAKARGEVLEISAVVKVITNDYITLKQRLRQVAQRIAPLVVGETDELEVKQIISEEIDDALTELSNEYYAESEELSE